MNIQIFDAANADLPVNISGINAVALYDTGANINCVSYACYMRLKDLPSLKMISAMSVHSGIGHYL